MTARKLTQTQRRALRELRGCEPTFFRRAPKTSRTMNSLRRRGLVRRRDYRSPGGAWTQEWISLNPKTGLPYE
jgi:hypothetical protein